MSPRLCPGRGPGCHSASFSKEKHPQAKVQNNYYCHKLGTFLISRWSPWNNEQGALQPLPGSETVGLFSSRWQPAFG